MSEAEFDDLYGTEALCHAALVRWRWPDGFECPDCEGQAHCIVKRGTRILYQCNACRKQTSVKAGTIFASSKLRLRLWFKAMYHLTQSKKGVSSLELGRRLGVTQTTAWTLKHKLAQVMMERNAAKRLKGDVQMDDAYKQLLRGHPAYGADDALGCVRDRGRGRKRTEIFKQKSIAGAETSRNIDHSKQLKITPTISTARLICKWRPLSYTRLSPPNSAPRL